MKKTCLILGAGASLDMGYPTGKGLREKIIRDSPSIYSSMMKSIEPSINTVDVERFTFSFQASNLYSIDAFLGRRPEFETIGKMAIACAVLTAESTRSLTFPGEDDGWYRYLHNQFTSRDYETIDFSDLSIVTFNYDRSLEFFLAHSLCETYNLPLSVCLEKVSEIDICHIYGDVGPISDKHPEYFYYGYGLRPETLNTAYRRLRVIPEGRNTDESVVMARKMISAAQNVVFLGFGFDRLNIERLGGGTEVFSPSVQTEQGQILRSFYGTTIGMFQEEVFKAIKRLHKPISPIADAAVNFKNVNCTNLLRMTQILEQN